MKQKGFTLVEVLVITSIMAVLAAVVYAGFNSARQQSRDADRQSDLRTVQTALELYKQKWGRYPEGCRPVGSWSGQPDTNYACPDGSSRYIVGAAGRYFVPDYIATLPIDPRRNGSASGYAYRTNADGTVYKLMAKNTVESEVVTDRHPLNSCALTGSNACTCANGTVRTSGQSCPDGSYCVDKDMCLRVQSAGNSLPSYCQASNQQFRTSYAVSGGYANVVGSSNAAQSQLEIQTEAVVCSTPL